MADSRATLKAFFETGDIPTQAQFAALIDSLASLADTNLFEAQNTHDADINLSDGIVEKAVNGGGELNLRSGNVNGRASLTSDNDGQLEGFVIVNVGSAEIGFGTVGDLFLDASGAILAADLNNKIEVLLTGVQICKAAGKLGHFGSAPIVKPTVTGSRAGNAALASLLTALDSLGILTDSSTA